MSAERYRCSKPFSSSSSSSPTPVFLYSLLISILSFFFLSSSSPHLLPVLSFSVLTATIASSGPKPAQGRIHSSVSSCKLQKQPGWRSVRRPKVSAVRHKHVTETRTADALCPSARSCFISRDFLVPSRRRPAQSIITLVIDQSLT